MFYWLASLTVASLAHLDKAENVADLVAAHRVQSAERKELNARGRVPEGVVVPDELELYGEGERSADSEESVVNWENARNCQDFVLLRYRIGHVVVVVVAGLRRACLGRRWEGKGPEVQLWGGLGGGLGGVGIGIGIGIGGREQVAQGLLVGGLSLRGLGLSLSLSLGRSSHQQRIQIDIDQTNRARAAAAAAGGGVAAAAAAAVTVANCEDQRLVLEERVVSNIEAELLVPLGRICRLGLRLLGVRRVGGERIRVVGYQRGVAPQADSHMGGSCRQIGSIVDPNFND